MQLNGLCCRSSYLTQRLLPALSGPTPLTTWAENRNSLHVQNGNGNAKKADTQGINQFFLLCKRSESRQRAHSVEKHRFSTKAENICPHSATEEFWRGVRLKWASGLGAASWNLSRQSSRSFSKAVLLAEILETPIWEFFNRISPNQPS